MNKIEKQAMLMRQKQRKSAMPIWRSTGGLAIPMSEMSDRYLENAINCMLRDGQGNGMRYVDKNKLAQLNAERDRRWRRSQDRRKH